MSGRGWVWILRIVPAIILLQTLFFKFTGSAESVYIFSALGMEPYGRIASGIVELIAAIMILFPKTTVYGALLAAGTMFGAILSHLTVLGIEVENDGGFLFGLAILTFVFCSILAVMDRHKLFLIFNSKKLS